MTTTIATAALSLRALSNTITPRRGARTLLAALALTGGSGALAAELPLRSVTLYRSGVAYLERSGRVGGEGDSTLSFDLAHLNDVLRSLVVLDDGATSPPSVSFTSTEPLDRLLSKHQIDVRRINTQADLLGQLKGVAVALTTADGPVNGQVLSVEARNFKDESGQYVTLVTDTGVKSVNLARVSSFEVRDERVAKDLRDALRTIAQRRAENVAEVTIDFGDGPERTATVGYMHESPVWKTSYRLVLPEETGGKPLLQGWAIVENQTDEDWDDVRLSLASGRPVAFTMDLCTPLFIARPEIAPPIPGTVMTRAYDDGVRMVQKAAALASRAELQRDNSAYMGQSFGRAMNDSAEAGATPATPAMGGTLVGQNAAGAAASGEQFRYEIAQPVDVAAKSNAMLPIVASPVEGRRVSIYNANDLAEHPMRGVEFTNTSGADLAAGPITVYDGDSYAGDAQVGFTSRGQDRILSYAVDQDVRVLREVTESTRTLRVSIVKGALDCLTATESVTSLTLVNRDQTRGRTILIEESKKGGPWKLTTPEQPDSESETLYRFRIELQPGETRDFEVVQTWTRLQKLNITDTPGQATPYMRQGQGASPAVIEALREGFRLQRVYEELARQVDRLDHERDEITKDQARIRSNMGPIDRNSDLYSRYMRALNEQEDRLDAITQERADLVAKRSAALNAFREYFFNLTVE